MNSNDRIGGNAGLTALDKQQIEPLGFLLVWGGGVGFGRGIKNHTHHWFPLEKSSFR